MKEIFTLGQIIDGMDGNQEIPEHMYCGDCGLLLCDDQAAFKLEEMFSQQRSRASRPCYVDICDCNGE